MSGSRPSVVDRRQLDLSAAGVPVQPYHAASGLGSLKRAAALIRRAEAVAEDGALSGLAGVVEEHRDVRLVAAGIPEAAVSAPADLARVLSAHTLLHTAEGELFREALATAASSRGLHVQRLPARDVVSYAASLLDVTVDDLSRTVLDLGKDLGSPWRKDEKVATMCAWVGLASYVSAGLTS